MAKESPPSQGRLSRAGALLLRSEFAFCSLLPERYRDYRRVTQFKPKNESKANWNLDGSFQVLPPVILSRRGPHADWIREVDWRTEIRGNEPVRTRADHRFRPRLEQGPRTDGAFAAGAGGLHRHRRGHYLGKEAAEARIPGSHLLGRTCGGAAHGLDEVGNALSFPGPSRRRGGKARHPAQRGQILLRCGHAQENGHAFVALRNSSASLVGQAGLPRACTAVVLNKTIPVPLCSCANEQ